MLTIGLTSMPGGGAEIFSRRVARELRYLGKAQAPRWLEIHAMAHERGIPSNATMLYGHIETYGERVEHLRLLREQQDQSGGFLAFIPLEYQPNDEQIVARHASALDDLKTVAVSRLMLDNFPHIKAYWIMLQEDTAGIALGFGADDIDGTIVTERVAHAADARSPVGNTRQRLVRLIRDADKVPVERDALYNELRVYTEEEASAIASSGTSATIASPKLALSACTVTASCDSPIMVPRKRLRPSTITEVSILAIWPCHLAKSESRTSGRSMPGDEISRS